MQLILLLTVLAIAPAAEAVRADPVDVPAIVPEAAYVATPTSAPAPAEYRLHVAAFRAEGVPAWVARQMRSAVVAELVRAQLPVDVDPDPATSALYEVTGDVAAQGDRVVVRCTIRHVPSGTIIQRFDVRGDSVNLIQVREALAKSAAATFATPLPAPAPAPTPAVAATPPAPAAPPAARTPTPGDAFRGSTLEWAVENPGDFQDDLRYWSRRSTTPRGYRGWPVFGYPIYGYPIYPLPVIPRYHVEQRSSFGLELQYRGSNSSIDLRLGY